MDAAAPDSAEIEIVNDGEGLALIGDPSAIDAFLTSNGLASEKMNLSRLRPHVQAAAGVAQAHSDIAANSGRWIKLTKESARALHQGTAMKGSTPQVSRAVLTKGGRTSHILEYSGKHAGSLLTNPAVLTGAAGIMAQIAMQQAMDEITDYLKVIDAKVDDVLRAQKDAVIADMIGVEIVIAEALGTREQVGRVSEITWSKVQGSATTIARTQAYALLQLDSQVDKLEQATSAADVQKASHAVASVVPDWLAVLARCVQLQDACAVLELERVMDVAPEDLEDHRLALRAARKKRLDAIESKSSRILQRITVASTTANEKVLFHPLAAKHTLAATGSIGTAVLDFQRALEIEGAYDDVAPRRWIHAAVDARDSTMRAGASGVERAKRIGAASASKAAKTAGGLTKAVSDRVTREDKAE